MSISYSKNQINRSGVMLSTLDPAPDEFSSAMDVLSELRLSHEQPLQSAFEIIQATSKKIDKSAIFARRLKRSASIVSKLQRSQGKMKLSRMQDIGGCRVIVSTEKKLRKIVRELRKMSEFKAEDGTCKVKDYLDVAKNDGYRSYHIIGRFLDSAGVSRNIEVQLRTRIQHYWATSVEIVDLFTGQALKSNQGDPEWSDFFSEISKQFAQMEEVHFFSQLNFQKQFNSYLQILENDENLLYDCFGVQTLAKSLRVTESLNAYANSLKIIDDRLAQLSGSGYVLLRIETDKHSVTARMYESEDSAAAEKEYIKLEKETVDDPLTVIALVSSAAVGGIKEAYPNYFADSTEFLKLLNLITEVKHPKQLGLFERIFGKSK